MNFLNKNINYGEYTEKIYILIKDGFFKDAIIFLNQQLSINPTCRPALSLLAYCNFYQQNFSASIANYQQLIELFPNNLQYKLDYALTLYEASNYDQALQITFIIDQELNKLNLNENLRFKFNHKKYESIKLATIKLQSAIKYAQEDFVASKTLLDQIDIEEVDKEANLACLMYKEKKYDLSLEKFLKALQLQGKFKSDLSYSIALCYYKKKDYKLALQYIGEIIEKGIKEYPELSVGSATEGIEVKSVGNSIKLQETFLIEAFNLKAAIEFKLNKLNSACESMTDMPPRSEEELDIITLHNQALINIDLEPAESFEKLHFLLKQNFFPIETFLNLLLLYCKYGYYEFAADLMAENTEFTFKYLSLETYELLDALITCQTSSKEAYKKFDDMISKYSDKLRKLNKQLNELKSVKDNDKDKLKYLKESIENSLDTYIIFLMNQAKIYWDLENYEQIEKIFRKSVEFCSDNSIWKLNVAHVLFMQGNKFKEAAGFYESLVKQNYDNILNVSAIVLANLCVCYIMTSQNENAEELIRKIEKEEEEIQFSDPEGKFYHLCIVNLVIGTLYCSKGNYEFGISRIIKNLVPYNKKLNAETWFYVKRCFLSLMENISKQVLIIQDNVIDECIKFLNQCEFYGKNIKTLDESFLDVDTIDYVKKNITYEARLLKYLFIKLL